MYNVKVSKFNYRSKVGIYEKHISLLTADNDQYSQRNLQKVETRILASEMEAKMLAYHVNPAEKPIILN